MIRILLVEDNRGDARLFAELIEELPERPFAVTAVDSLATAVTVIDGYDVVFLDLSLPDSHGLDTLAAMRDASTSTPIVVLTGSDDESLALEVMKRGAQDYLRKAEITPSLIARTAWYAIERRKVDASAKRLAVANEATRRARLIASVTSAINASFELTTTLAEVTRLLVPTLADFVVIDLVKDTQLVRVAHASRDRTLEAVMGSSAYRFVAEGGPVRRALAEGSSLVFGHAELSGVTANDDSYHRAAARAGAHSMLVTPLATRDRIVGAITYLSTTPEHTFDDPEQLLLAEEVAHRVAVGIDNARLYATAQQAIRARDELLAVVSHDLRNPLGIVALALGMIERDPAQSEVAVPRAKRGIERMQRLIEDLLDIARIEAGTLHVEPAPIVLGTFLTDAIEQHRDLATDKGVHLVADFEGRIGAAVADRHRLGQAVANLLANAVKFTPAGGTIRVSAVTHSDRVVIAVADDGPGISPEHIDHVFDRYWQPERRRDGLGLGLAIVKGIVDAHGGTVEVESILGQGATFRVVLKRNRSMPTEALAALER